MRLRLTRAGRSSDVIVTVPDGSTPLAAILRAAGVDPLPPHAVIEGRPVSTHERFATLPLHDGSTIGLDPPAARPLHRPAAKFVQVAGGLSGRSVDLPVGLHDVGPATTSGRVEAPVVRIGVEAGGTLTIATVGQGAIRLDGVNLAGPVLEPLRPGMHLATAEALFRVGPCPGPDPATTAPSSAPPTGASGRTRYQRTAYFALPPIPPPPTPPKRPVNTSSAPQLSWAMVLAPIPVAVGMAVLLSPHFLIFAAFTPVLALGRWAEGVWRHRRTERVLTAGWARALRDYETELTTYAADRAARLRAATPDLAALLDLARRGAPGLWSARPGTHDHLQLPVGYGDQPGSWELPPAGELDVAELGRRLHRLPDVPIGLDLGRHLGVGVVGEAASDLAASALVQAAASHGPAQLEIALVCDPDRLGRWDWLKWLPHTRDASGGRAVATRPGEVAGLFDAAADPGPTRVVVVDSDVMLEAVLTRFAALADRSWTRLCVVAAIPERLPSACTQVAVLQGGRLSVADLLEAVTVRGVLPACGDRPTVSELARALARYVDPEIRSSAATLPRSIGLLQVLGGGFAATDLAVRWAQPGPGLFATLGATEDGPLVVDLIADGPHMLVAGTTGSGKSELLRTLVASLACRYGPDRLNLVLVDFKGGGAFDACADLPHTVGVVTDLDEQLAARALRCLRAELRHRERVLRAAGVADLSDLRGPYTPARLVLVVDEFATLAAELGDFMGSLVDIAQRGRSLGLHLVLATQRPSGVVDSKIRANTNLRIALRVQSEADSHDVLGTPIAAQIDRRTPGRGFALLGAGDLQAFQTALVSTQTPTSGPRTVRVEPFTLAGPGAVRMTVPAPPAAGPTDLQQIVEASRAASAGLPPARVPWPAPLPDRLAADALWSTATPVSGTIHLGLVDRPDEQRVNAFRWDHRRGPLLAYGADARTTTGLVVTAAADLVRRYAAHALHLYLLDFVPGSGLDRLAGLPHVAARVGLDDHELLLRVVDALELEVGRRQRARAAGRSTDEVSAPLIMVGLTGYHHVLSVAEELGRIDLPGRLERLITEGSPLGIVTVLTTHHERGVPGRLGSQISARVAFRLADPAAYVGFGLRPKALPDLRADRALDLESGDEVVIATPTSIVSAGEGSGRPRVVENLAERISAEVISGYSRREGVAWRLALGSRHRDLAPAIATLHPGTHLVVTGGPGSGRTTTLRTLADAVRDTGPAGVRVLTSRPDEWSLADQVLVGAGSLTEPIGGPTLVVVDGLESAAGVDTRLGALAENPLVRLVAADRSDAFRLAAPWLRQVLASRSGILLQPQPDHGDLIRVRLPMRQPVAHPRGRGYLVENGFAELIQVALPRVPTTTSCRGTSAAMMGL